MAFRTPRTPLERAHVQGPGVPIVLGRGVRLWDGLESLESRFAVESVTTPSGVTHVTSTRRDTP